MTTLLGYDNYNKNLRMSIGRAKGDRRFFYIPWDVNATFGQWWGHDARVSDDHGAGRRGHADRQWHLAANRGEPFAARAARCSFCSCAHGPDQPGLHLCSLFDQLSAEARPSALRAADRQQCGRSAPRVQSSGRSAPTSTIVRHRARLSPLVDHDALVVLDPALHDTGRTALAHWRAHHAFFSADHS